MKNIDANDQFINEEMWFYQNTPTGGNDDYWVEVGITVGYLITPNGRVVATSPHYFWADQRPNSEYWEHDWGGASTNAYHTAEIHSTSAHDWAVSIAGHSSTSTNNFAGAGHLIAAGAESTETANSEVGSVSSLQYQSLTGTWVSSWVSSHSGGAIIYPPDTNLYARWVKDYWWLQAGENETSCS